MATLLDMPIRQRTLGNMLARRAALGPDRTCLLFEDQSFTYRQALEISNRLANGLLAEGVRPGEHIALMIDNKPDMLWINFAIARIGGVIVPVNTAAKDDLLAYYINQSDSSIVIVDAAHYDRLMDVSDRCPHVRMVAVHEEGGFDVGARAHRCPVPLLAWSDLAKGSPEDPPVTVRFDQLAYILYTSGTTGPSKGSTVPHATAIGIIMKYVRAFRYTEDDVLYTGLPLFHSNALNTSAFPAFFAGGTLALSRRFTASRFWDEVKKYGATQFSLLSAMINIIWNRPPGPEDRDHKVRLCQILPTPPFFHAFQERFGVKIVSLYSLSDFGMGSILEPDHPPEKWRSAGKVQPDIAVAILDEDDMPLPTGQIGEICLRNMEPWICRQGYYKMPEAFLKACRNLWFHTGDRGYLDEDGYLYWVDRLKDSIRRRGENVSAYEVEQIIERHPAVAEVAAFAVRSEMSEDEVMVTIVCKDGETLTPEELVRFCDSRMMYFMVPRFVAFTDMLPKTMSQKIEKYKLKQEAETRLSEIWDRERSGIKLTR